MRRMSSGLTVCPATRGSPYLSMEPETSEARRRLVDEGVAWISLGDDDVGHPIGQRDVVAHFQASRPSAHAAVGVRRGLPRPTSRLCVPPCTWWKKTGCAFEH